MGAIVALTPAAAALLPALPVAAIRPHLRLGVIGPAVLGVELDRGAGVGAEAAATFRSGRVLPPKRWRWKRVDRGVGDRFEGVAQGALDRVGLAGEVDLDRLGVGAAQVDDEVGELVVWRSAGRPLP